MNLRELAKRHLPYPAKQGLKYICSAIPPRFRYGKVFWDTYSFLQKSQWWRREKLEEYQMQQLRRALHHACENVPYYRRVFEENGRKSKKRKESSKRTNYPNTGKEIPE